MSYYSINTPTMKKNGTANIHSFESINSPYNFLENNQTTLYRSNVPFSLLFTRFCKDEENPFRIILLSPDFSLNTTLSLAEFNEVVKARGLHQHDTYELMYILSGNLTQKIEATRHRYIENSCCLINRSVRHAEEYETDFHSVNLSLSRDFFVELIEEGEHNYFQNEKKIIVTDLTKFIDNEFHNSGTSGKKYIDFTPRDMNSNIYRNIYTIFDQITNLILNPIPGTSLAIKALIYRILYYLNSKDYYDTNPIQVGSPSESILFAKITELMENTYGRISRNELSAQLSYSGNYINRTVQKYTGMSIFQYGTSIAMQQAAHMLLNTDLTVSEIIEHLRFMDRTHFYNLFKNEYGMTPRQYRLLGKNV